MSTADPAAEVLAAADALLAAFGAHDADGYFAAFAPDATFLFHTTPDRLGSRAEYRALWRTWEEDDGFRVLACSSTGRHVQLLGDAAVFTHDVRTRLRSGGEESTVEERETIVFARTGGRWLAVHEHLSPAPAA